MDFSLKLIMDELGFEADINIPDDINPRFSFVELYSPAGTAIPSDKLLVCGLTEALAVTDRDGVYFLCIRDRMVDETETPENMCGITVVKRNMDLRNLFNDVQRVFVKLNTWILQMEQSISANKGIQDLLTISESIIQNHITVQDSTFKLLYYTNGIKTTDAITNKLIKYGYHPPETVQLMQKLRRLEEYEHFTEIFISRDYATSEYEVAKKMFRVGGAVVVHVVMICCGRPATEGLMELFSILLGYIKIYVDRDSDIISGNNAIKKLALDLITKNVRNPEEAKHRASYVGFPNEGSFRLVVISLADEKNIPFNRLILSFADMLPQALVFSHNRNVLILGVDRIDTEQLKSIIDKALDSRDILCGMSNAFSNLWGISIAYEQALMAVDIAGRMKLPLVSADSPHKRYFYKFSDYWMYHLIAAGIGAAPAVYRDSFLFQSIDKLREYDAIHHTRTFILLRAYLENERKATVVSTLLHMHRNTVLYHISKIESILGISLDDPEIRLKLQLAFKADDFGPGIFKSEPCDCEKQSGSDVV